MATNKRYAQTFILPFHRNSKTTLFNPLSKAVLEYVDVLEITQLLTGH